MPWKVVGDDVVLAGQRLNLFAPICEVKPDRVDENHGCGATRASANHVAGCRHGSGVVRHQCSLSQALGAGSSGMSRSAMKRATVM